MQNIDESVWRFPDVAYLDHEKVNDFGCSTQLIAQAEKISQLNAIIEEKDKEIFEIRQTMNVMKSEIAQLTESRLKLFDNLQQSMARLANDICDDSVEIIKKLVKNLIQKEINSDENTMKKIVRDLLDKVNADSDITIEVSTFDFQTLAAMEHAKSFKITSNAALNIGDVIVTSQKHGLMFDMEQTIKEMMGR